MPTHPARLQSVYLAPGVVEALLACLDAPYDRRGGGLIGYQHDGLAIVRALSIPDPNDFEDADEDRAVSLAQRGPNAHIGGVGSWRSDTTPNPPTWPPLSHRPELMVSATLHDRAIRCYGPDGRELPWRSDPFVQTDFRAATARVALTPGTADLARHLLSQPARPEHHGGFLSGVHSLSTTYIMSATPFALGVPADFKVQRAALPDPWREHLVGVYGGGLGPLDWAMTHPWLSAPGRVVLDLSPGGVPRAYTGAGLPLRTELIGALPGMSAYTDRLAEGEAWPRDTARLPL